MDLSYRNLTEIPNNLPSTLQKLYISENQITEIKNLPDSLKDLYIDYNQIREIKNLPNSLKELWISKNQIREIKNLPNSLKELWISKNQIREIKNLPNSLKELWISNNQIREINNLPSTLQKLDIAGNQIREIKNLPRTLQCLSIYNNPIEYINPVLYKHQLHNQLCEYIDTTHDRLKLCYLYKIAYLIPKLQRWWRKKNIQLKSGYKIDINTEIKYKPGVGIEYFNSLENFNNLKRRKIENKRTFF
jgi:Leucine-rich repeat (LRR) protein